MALTALPHHSTIVPFYLPNNQKYYYTDLFKLILSFISPLEKAIPLVNNTWHKAWRGRVVHLRITVGSDADERYIKKLVIGLQEGDFNHLTHLSLDGLFNTGYALSILAAAPANLKKLSYRYGYAKEEDRPKLAAVLCRFSQLEKLDLSRFIGSFPVPELSCTKSLISLSLAHTSFINFPFCPNLQHADFSDCTHENHTHHPVHQIDPKQFSTLKILRCEGQGPKIPASFKGHIYTQSEICNASEAMLNALLELGADIDCTDSLGRTALHKIDWEKATWNQIKRFIDGGAEINYANEYGLNSIYIWAYRSKSLEVGEELLKRNGYIHLSYCVSPRAAFSPFAYKKVIDGAASSDYLPVEKIKLLIKHGANPNFFTFFWAFESKKRIQVIWTLTLHKMKKLALSFFRSIKKRILSPSLQDFTLVGLGISVSYIYFKIVQKPLNR